MNPDERAQRGSKKIKDVYNTLKNIRKAMLHLFEI